MKFNSNKHYVGKVDPVIRTLEELNIANSTADDTSLLSESMLSAAVNGNLIVNKN